jgi:hypothetical protein
VLDLEKRSGSLAIGMCMLTHVLPCRGTRGSGKRKGYQDPSWKMSHFDKERFAAVRGLYESLQPKFDVANEDVAAG